MRSNLLDQPCPCGAALLGRDGQLGLWLLGGADMDGWLRLMVALPPLGSEEKQVWLTEPPSRSAVALLPGRVSRGRVRNTGRSSV